MPYRLVRGLADGRVNQAAFLAVLCRVPLVEVLRVLEEELHLRADATEHLLERVRVRVAAVDPVEAQHLHAHDNVVALLGGTPGLGTRNEDPVPVLVCLGLLPNVLHNSVSLGTILNILRYVHERSHM